jgi:murein DD-endopeptidase MepM/ murein hydrolase activator NlpD
MDLEEKILQDADFWLKPKRPKKRPPLFLFAALIIVLAAVTAFFVFNKKKPQPIIGKITAPLPKSEPPPLAASEEIIKKGQTLSDILSSRKFTTEEIYRLKERAKPIVDLNKIIAGRRMRFFSDSGGVVQTIEYSLGEQKYLVIIRDGSDFKAAVKEYPFETRLFWTSGIIEDHLIGAFERQNEKALLAMALADLLAWDIDFYTELRRGDSFRMVYEKKFLDGKFTGYGEILAAEFICQGRKFQAFRFVYPDTQKADHFDAEGKSLRKEFLRSPLPYARITSRFSFSRLHPIHKVYMAHYGVDYGAPIGTPVQATAEGVVVSAGWNGGAGQMIKIRHKNSYETMYLHLSRIFVKEGDRVKAGADIGAVGSSGESTGPHLDYRITQGGSYINPLSKRFAPVTPLRPEYKNQFQKTVAAYLVFLDAPLILAQKVFFYF